VRKIRDRVPAILVQGSSNQFRVEGWRQNSPQRAASPVSRSMDSAEAGASYEMRSGSSVSLSNAHVEYRMAGAFEPMHGSSVLRNEAYMGRIPRVSSGTVVQPCTEVEHDGNRQQQITSLGLNFDAQVIDFYSAKYRSLECEFDWLFETFDLHL
jgi:hypothetical protein